MKKTFLVLMCFVLLLTGCGKENTNNTATNKGNGATAKENVDLTNVQSKIENLGVNVSKEEVFYEMVGASDGMKLLSDEYRIEIYKFDKKSDEYKLAEQNQKLTLDGSEMSFDAVVKNGYAYLIDDEFPEHDAIVNILEQLK